MVLRIHLRYIPIGYRTNQEEDTAIPRPGWRLACERSTSDHLCGWHIYKNCNADVTLGGRSRHGRVSTRRSSGYDLGMAGSRCVLDQPSVALASHASSSIIPISELQLMCFEKSVCWYRSRFPNVSQRKEGRSRARAYVVMTHAYYSLNTFPTPYSTRNDRYPHLRYRGMAVQSGVQHEHLEHSKCILYFPPVPTVATNKSGRENHVLRR